MPDLLAATSILTLLTKNIGAIIMGYLMFNSSVNDFFFAISLIFEKQKYVKETGSYGKSLT